jgi:conjugal transfer pilus assembly protein TraI
MARLLDSDQLPGIPKSPDTILEILIDAGVLLARDAASATWTIYPGQNTAPIEAVKLATPAILFATLANPPSPLPYPLTKPRAQPDAATNASTGASKGKVKRPQTAVQLPLPGTAVQDSPPTPLVEQNISAPDMTPPSPQPLENAEGWATPRFSLAAPIRLNPALRSALEAVVDTMNSSDHGPIACRTVSTGLFVPLEELERRHIDPAFAIRALDELSMLVGSATDKLKTTLRDFGGEQKPGIVIAPRFIAGIDPHDFVAGETPLGDQDARA